MNLDETILENAERYINGTMSPEEQAKFEEKVKTDAAYARIVNEYIEFFEALNHYTERQNVKMVLDEIHSDIKTSAKVIEMKQQNTGYTLVRSITYRMIGVAAAVAIMAIAGTIVTMNFYNANRKTTGYIEMKKYVDSRINNSEKNLISQIKTTTSPNKKPASGGIYSGTGFLLTGSGFLVTSYHVVKDATTLQVVNEGYAYDAKLIAADAVCDYAVLKINDESFEKLKSIPYSFFSTKAEMGQKVFTLGYPRADLVFGEGSVSSLTGFADDTIAYQVSVPLNPGNSGGPLFDENGNIIGVISGKQSRSEAAAFAIKSSYLIESLNNIADTTFKNEFRVYSKSKLTKQSRVQQIKSLKPYVFEVRVIN